MVLKKYLSKFTNMSEATKASFFFTICSFVQKGIALLTTPVFTRLLSTTEYGNYTVYQSWYAIAIIFCTLHVEHGTFSTGLIKYENIKKRFAASLLGLTTTLTIIFFLLALWLKNVYGLLSDISNFMLLAMFLQILFVPSFSVWSANERFNFRYKKVIAFTLAYAILNPLLSIALIYITKDGSNARIAGMVIAQIIIGGYFYLYLLKEGKCFFSKELWKFSILFSLPLIPHYLSETILQQADRLMIAFYIGKSEAAIYAVAYTISMMVTYVSNAINQSFLPYLYQSIKSDDTSKIKTIQKELLILVLAACVLAMIFAPEILTVFATSDYSSAIEAIPPIVVSTYFIFLYNHFCYVEMYFEKNIFIMVASIAAALLNVILNSVFIPIFGFVAAGYTTLISYMAFCSLHYFMYKRIVKQKKLKSFYDVKALLVISTAAVFITVVMKMIYNYIMLRYLIIVGILVICGIYKNKIINLFAKSKIE